MAVLTIIDEKVSTLDFKQIENYLLNEGIEIGKFFINDLSKKNCNNKPYPMKNG